MEAEQGTNAADRGSALSEGLGPNAEDDECSAPPRVTDAPADVWLVYGDLDRNATHWECCRDGEVAWCEDKQYDSDVHYVRGDRYDDLHTALAELLACHTESAGFTMSMLADRAEFDAMLARSQERLEAAVGAARVALGMCAKCGLPPGCPDCRAVHDVGPGA